MRSHYLLLCIVVCGAILLHQSSTFAYYQKQMYCEVSKDRIVVSLQKGDGIACKSYIRYIEVAMKKTYRDVLDMQLYIDKKQDLGYRKPLKEDRVARIKRLQDHRLLILSHMQSFEQNLLKTSKTYFLNSLGTYWADIKRAYKHMQAATPSFARDNYLLLLREQLDVLEAFSASTRFEDLEPLMQRFLYLKQQIGGK